MVANVPMLRWPKVILVFPRVGERYAGTLVLANRKHRFRARLRLWAPSSEAHQLCDGANCLGSQASVS